jgi:hypothetical protein
MNTGGSSGFGKKPVPAAHGVSSAYDPQTYDLAQAEPDTNTLSGTELFGVGSLQRSRNIFDPTITVSALGLTNPTGTAGQSNLQGETLVGGTLNFSRIWSKYHFTTAYNGGGILYLNQVPGYNRSNQSYHNLDIAQVVDGARWHLRLRDDFVAAPGASFGGAGMGGPGLIGQMPFLSGATLNSIVQGFAPSETIQTGLAMRYVNTVLGEVQYSFSRRSAFVLAGSYGILHFNDAGYVSSHSINGQAGYDYLLTPKNSVAIIASYAKIDYTGTAISTEDYGAALAFGRKVTGRLAFQASAGAQQIHVAATANGNFQFWTWSVNSALTYERRRSGFSLALSRGLTGGSGVFFGATSYTVSGSAHHQFSRFWSGSVNSGYAFNRSLAPVGTPTTSFNTVFAGANIGRQIGRHFVVGFNYGLQRQYNAVVCPVASCGVTGFQHTFGMTVDWHLRRVN